MQLQRRQGLFWIPDHPDSKISGTLITDGLNRITMETEHDFDRLHWPDCIPLIHGILKHEHVKLLHCSRTHESSEITKLLYTQFNTWTAQTAFIGEPFNSDQPEAVTSAEISFPDADQWVQGFEDIHHERDSTNITWPSAQSTSDANWRLGTIAINFSFFPQYRKARYHYEFFSVKPHASLLLQFEQPQPWSVIPSIIASLQVLLTLSQGKPVNHPKVLITEQPDSRVHVLYKPILTYKEIPPKDRPLFTINEIDQHEGIAAWLQCINDMTVLKNTIVSDRYRVPTLVTDRTGHLIIACEAYCRYSKNSTKERLSLRSDILKPMTQEAGNGFANWVGNIDDWIKRVANVRNYAGVAHIQEIDNPSIDDQNINEINQQLELLALICIFKQCSFPDKLIQEMINRSRSEAIGIL